MSFGKTFHLRQIVRGVYVGSVSMFEHLVAALERSGIRPVIDHTFAFKDARAAWDHLASARHLGKVVVSIG